MMRSILIALLTLSSISMLYPQQRVGIGVTTPVAKLDIRGLASQPTVPSTTSNGIVRIGVSANEGIDIGKMDSAPFSGWMQSGFNGNAEPLSLQPLGGNVGVGTTNPITKLNITGTSGGPSIPGTTSTGIVRIGVSAFEAIDMGKMSTQPYSGWIQSGYNGVAEPLTLQPSGGNVGIGTSNPANSAILEMNSTSRGLLPPRMSMANRNTIVSPVEGLMIWCNDCGVFGQIQVYNGVAWTDMIGGPTSSLPFVGSYDGGGIVAYILQSGDPGFVAGEVHGLIAAPNDIISIEWGCEGINQNASGIAIGQGDDNTVIIMNGCGTPGIAARVCGDMVLNGYNDWVLPSKNELNRLYNNREAIGGFSPMLYWSSSEISHFNALFQNFLNGEQPNIAKSATLRIRPIRYF